MISAEAPVLFAKACELFIRDLTKRSWLHAEENKRRTLQVGCELWTLPIDVECFLVIWTHSLSMPDILMPYNVCAEK